MKKLLLCAISLSVIAGCASRANKIEPGYASSSNYENLSCSALREEAVRLSVSASDAIKRQNKAANTDAIKTGVGLVLFWPVLFLNEGDGKKAAEVARLKGEMIAVERASQRKNCNISFQKS
ncbi:hypothetical protein [Ochrobactrum sp. Marseille-Q0166]|uniref:hypothetical protein n=1 Tax=Ochrobactrum sp. Marseille-Q0166 TaxID=2761105 RepID=UPI001655FF3B|nr:hypothetical protein [Ochrobactrum sp. Marseille-Q0166]MBC8716975.1 hypothetical protein [Ochrobactrum sp. Marseille-Q0166]